MSKPTFWVPQHLVSLIRECASKCEMQRERALISAESEVPEVQLRAKYYEQYSEYLSDQAFEFVYIAQVLTGAHREVRWQWHRFY